MAIYRQGTASMNNNGVITGVGTKWQDKLSLIRVGATMVFMTQPLAICTISAIVSDTELRATQTDGKVVPAGTNYVILLHDSITVDGLAQDVAETLRYYQSKETVIQDAIDFFQDFDFDKYKATAEQVKADAAAAKVSQTAAKTSETNAKTSETNAKASETAAAASKTAAAASQTAAKTSETNAKTSETNANSSKNAAAASQTAAKTSETNAKTSETNAKASETNAGNSRTAAAGSATAAAGSASAADASKTAAATSASQASGSATAAAGSASAAKTSETNAKTSENNAKAWADSVNPANLAQLDRSNTFREAQVFSKGVKVAGTFADPLLIESINPTIKFRETDRPSGAPEYSVVFDGGNFRIQRDDNGANLISYNRDSNTITLVRADYIDKGGSRSNLGLGNTDNVAFGNVNASGGVNMRSDGGSTSPVMVAQVFNQAGTTLLGQAEFRTNQNGNLELINRTAGTPAAFALSPDGLLSWTTNRIGGGLNVGSEINAGGVVRTTTPAGAFRTGTASNGFATLSTEGNYSMIWRRYEGSGVKTAEFFGINGAADAPNTSRMLFRKAIGNGASDYQDRILIHLPAGGRSGNVDADSNGFIKLASPIIKLNGNGTADINDEARGAEVERVGVGVYKITGVLGLNSDASWGGTAGGIEVPRDINGQPRLWVDYKVDSSGDLTVMTYHREHAGSPKFARNAIAGFSDGDPMDIPGDVFVTVRVEMPSDEVIDYGDPLGPSETLPPPEPDQGYILEE